jgi:hypothetical protein
MRLIVWAVLAGLVIYASASFGNASISPQVPLQIEFSTPIDLPTGTSVLLDGQRVGFVSENLPGSTSLTVSLDGSSAGLRDISKVIRPGAMAVVSSTWSKSVRQPISFIELLNPNLLENGSASLVPETPKGQSQTIVGYKDFESFWRNKQIRHWTDERNSRAG